MKLILFFLLSFYTGLLANEVNSNLCVNEDNYQICPKKKSKLINTLSIFNQENILKKQETQITFENIQVFDSLIKFLIVPEFEGYMTIVHVDSTGEKKQFFPNKNLPDNHVSSGQLIDLSYDKEKTNVASKEGLEYFIVIITSQRVYFSIAKKDITYNAFSDEKIFNEILKDIQSNKYGKHYLTLLPYYTLKEKK